MKTNGHLDFVFVLQKNSSKCPPLSCNVMQFHFKNLVAIKCDNINIFYFRYMMKEQFWISPRWEIRRLNSTTASEEIYFMLVMAAIYINAVYLQIHFLHEFMDGTLQLKILGGKSAIPQGYGKHLMTLRGNTGLPLFSSP